MTTNTFASIFDPQTIAADLSEVGHIYTELFTALDEKTWDIPVKGSPKEWTLHETLAHLYSLNGDGLEAIKHGLLGEGYTFNGLDNRYEFNAFNRKGIDSHLGVSLKELCARVVGILNEAASIARNLEPGQADLTMEMPIYNRPVRIVEALNIILFHAGLAHAAQVAEPLGLPPLWMKLSAEIRHRMVGRVLMAFSLLFRADIGGPLRATIAFRIDGPGGGEWYVNVAPESSIADEGPAERPSMVIHLRETAIFCRMITSRLNLPIALISGAMKLRGDLRLFLRMGDLFSVDARPKAAGSPIKSHTPHYGTESPSN